MFVTLMFETKYLISDLQRAVFVKYPELRKLSLASIGMTAQCWTNYLDKPCQNSFNFVALCHKLNGCTLLYFQNFHSSEH